MVPLASISPLDISHGYQPRTSRPGATNYDLHLLVRNHHTTLSTPPHPFIANPPLRLSAPRIGHRAVKCCGDQGVLFSHGVSEPPIVFSPRFDVSLHNQTRYEPQDPNSHVSFLFSAAFPCPGKSISRKLTDDKISKAGQRCRGEDDWKTVSCNL